jgi:hypothetical protein
MLSIIGTCLFALIFIIVLAGIHEARPDEGHAQDSVRVDGELLAIIAVPFAVIIGLELYFW